MKVSYELSDLVSAAMKKAERDFRKFKALGASIRTDDPNVICVEMIECKRSNKMEYDGESDSMIAQPE